MKCRVIITLLGESVEIVHFIAVVDNFGPIIDATVGAGWLENVARDSPACHL